MKLSKEAEFFIGKCYENGNVMSISPYINTVYLHEGKKYKFTQEVLEEMISTGSVEVMFSCKKFVNLRGVHDDKKESERQHEKSI